jgi:hypothetical protein
MLQNIINFCRFHYPSQYHKMKHRCFTKTTRIWLKWFTMMLSIQFLPQFLYLTITEYHNNNWQWKWIILAEDCTMILIYGCQIGLIWFWVVLLDFNCCLDHVTCLLNDSIEFSGQYWLVIRKGYDDVKSRKDYH